MPTTRDPFPYPCFENEDTFQGREIQKATYKKPSYIAQREDPWNRLNATPTLSSARRSYYYNDPEAPSNSLDYSLKSLYDHHNELLKDRNKTLFQLETFTDDHRRILKNRVKTSPTNQAEKSSIRQWVSPEKVNIYSLDGAIVSHHTAATNRGYSRKHDGGYYSI
ncbi:cilia- and flagella-associated protein 276 [Pelobates fuscus]|uniref:cilia- and flagella-associated protein 276 n=1 Tax=Pelobates fuscus TaxID=191477 RepID=UPI002FE4CCFC